MEIKTIVSKILALATLFLCVMASIEMLHLLFNDPDKTMFLLMKLATYLSVGLLVVRSKFSIKIKSNVINGLLLTLVSIGTVATIILGHFLYFELNKHLSEMWLPLIFMLYNVFYSLFAGMSDSPIRSFSDYLRTYKVGIVLWAVSLISLLVCFFVFFLDPNPKLEDQIMIKILVASALAQIIYLAIIISMHKGQKYIWISSMIYFFGIIVAFAAALFIIWVAIILVVGYFILKMVFSSSRSGSGSGSGSGGSCSSCGNWRGGICLAGRDVSNYNNESCSQYYKA